ncbi:MAG: site-specific integrase [Ruminococcus sp.]|nr:site-specific integrase [Ruminococcus sp.]
MRTQRNIYKRKDGRWEGRYFKEYDSKGKIKYGSVYAKTYNEVKIKLNSIVPNLLNFPEKNINVDFKDVCYEWIKNKKNSIKQSSYAKYSFEIERYIIPQFRNCKLYEINKNALCDLIASNRELSQKTLKHISIIFKSIVGYINEKYDFNIELREYQFTSTSDKRYNVLSTSEQEKLEKCLLRQTDLSKLGVYLCLYTGLRIGELCALKWSDIDLDNEMLRVSKTMQRIQNINGNINSKTKIIIETPKSDTSIRDIPLSKYIINLLKKYKPISTNNTYFLTGNINYIEPRTLQNKFKKYLEEANIENINFHALRHTFATKAIESGMDVKSVSEILGHSTVKMTLEKYVHITMEQKRKQINKLKPF